MITTERLIVRPFRDSDAGDLYDYLSRPEVFTFEHGGPVSAEVAQKIAREWAQSTQFHAMTLREPPHKLIGHVSLERSGPEHLRTWEIGYMVHPDFQRLGYAAEASRALIRYAFTELGAHRIVSHCSPENPASWKVLEKCGLRKEGLELKNIYFRTDENGDPRWFDSYWYAILEEEFFAGGGPS